MGMRINLQEFTLSDFFHEDLGILRKHILDDLERYQKKEGCLHYEIRPLPEEIETQTFPNHRAYYTYVPCNTEYVAWGRCILEIHYQNREHVQIFVIA